MSLQDPEDPQDEYEIPLHHKRPFGAGIKRKRIDFVPQSSTQGDTTAASSLQTRSAHDAYLSIVLPQALKPTDTSSQSTSQSTQVPESCPPDEAPSNKPEEAAAVCKICKLPLSTATEQTQIPHEASLVHQVCIEHSHPPSALDRRRKGLAYLQSYGWDPDSRTGLGVSGAGRLYPIRAEQKEDNRGLGAKAEEKDEAKTSVRVSGKDYKKAQEEAKRKNARMRDLVYGRDEVNKYLGIGL